LQDVSCFGPRNPAAPTFPSPQARLFGAWQDEQNGAGGDVGTYVRGDLELDASRFRKRFTFEPGGALSTNVLAPNDAQPTVRGTWSVTDGRLTITYRDEAAARDVTQTYEIVESTDSVLRLRQLPSP
jgi:hypothetical protein